MAEAGVRATVQPWGRPDRAYLGGPVWVVDSYRCGYTRFVYSANAAAPGPLMPKNLGKKRPGSFIPGGFKKHLRRGGFDNPATVKKDNPVGHRFGETKLVGYHEERHVLVRQLGHDIQHFLDHLRVQGAGGLVKKLVGIL